MQGTHLFQTQFYFTLTDKEEVEGIIDSVKNNISCKLSGVLILVLKSIKRKCLKYRYLSLKFCSCKQTLLYLTENFKSNANL